MGSEFLCPICRESWLEINVPTPWGRSRYFVSCPSCGASIDHPDFESYNGTIAFLLRYPTEE